MKNLIVLGLVCVFILDINAQIKVKVAKYKGNRQAAISYTFDDGLLDQYTVLFPQLKKYGIRASFCVNGNTINRYEAQISNTKGSDSLVIKKPRMTWTMLKKMSDQGQEITSHGWAHININKIDGEALRYEVQHNDTIIYEHTGIFPRTYFYPGNSKSPEKISFAERDRVGTRTSQVSIGSKRSDKWLHDWVRSLIHEGKWGVGMTHGIINGYDSFKDPKILWDHFADVNTLRDSIWIATFHDVAAYEKERDAVIIKVRERNGLITVIPKMKLNKNIFNEPLTLVISHPVIQALQDGKQLAITVKNGEGLVDINPTGSIVKIRTNLNFDLTKEISRYNKNKGYGWDITEGKHYFSVTLPEGNYLVTVVLGSEKLAGNTVVRAEDRRFYVENVKTRKGEFKDYSFVVNRRSSEIDKNHKISLTPRENKYLSWDDKLTLEFNGAVPTVKSIHIEQAPDTIPVLYLCGNSTVVDQRNEPWASWGQMINRWMDDGVVVINHAQSGLTAGSFLAQHRLDKIMKTLKKGDYVLCEFGHNDQKDHSSGSGAWYNFSYNLKIFIDNVRSKGAKIIFATPTRRRHFDEKGKIINTHGDFPAAIRAIAKRENVPVIELQEMTKTFFETLGEEKSKKALVHYPANTWPDQEKALADNTHFNPYGAYEVAKMIVMGMKELHLPLINHLRKDWKDFDPAHPDNPNTWYWYPSALTDITKPAGN